MPNPDLATSFTLVSFYRFRAVHDPDAVIQHMRALWAPFKVYGRVYVAEEGVNAQMAVPTNVLSHFEAACSLLEVLREEGEASRPGSFRVNCDSREMSADEYYTHTPFRALHIRRRKQILVDGLPEPLDWRAVHDELSPRDWHDRIPLVASPSTLHPVPLSDSSSLAPVILDCRNKYESDVGRFDGALPLDTETFQESWAALERILKDKDPATPIMTYCTGGIR
jgi:predicted sulfurtransferase